jgi:outer membrane protein assembly factor BamA
MNACFLLAILAGAPAVSVEPKQVEVAGVIITGNRNVSTERIKSFIPIRPGNEYPRDQLKDLLLEADQRIIESRMFRNVVPHVKDLPDGRVNVYFKVQEYPNLIEDIIYKNANHISKKELAEMTRLSKGIPLDPVTNKRAVYIIQDHLKRQGRYFANVMLEEGGDPSDHRVVFNITEGPVVRVKDIRFVGNHDSAISKRLPAEIGSATSGTFNPVDIDCDVLRLEDYYKKNGYMDVQATRELVFSDDLRSVTVIFHINKGVKYRIESVMVEGSRHFPKEEIEQFIRAKPGDCYKEDVVTADVKNITDFAAWRAEKAMVRKQLVCSDKPGHLRVLYEVDWKSHFLGSHIFLEDNEVVEKPPAKIGKIIIKGNEWTQDKVILKTIGLKPGQPLVYPELKLAELNLARLGIFEVDKEKGIRPTVTILESDSDCKDILVEVKETLTGSLVMGATINTKGQLVVSLTLEERNFDPSRFPTSLADIREGRAFRGAGKKLRLDVLRITAPGSLSVLRWYLK